MKLFNKKLTAIFIFSTIIFGKISASTFFSGFAGLRTNYSANESSPEYDPDLNLQFFFAGQFNFSENIWAHAEFSVDTGDFISEDFFHATSSKFRIDEVSAIFRAPFAGASNYFSIFLGTYDPIGSDVFLQRYFGINPITSKITESWLGLAGSTLYSQLGLGISDVIAFTTSPIAVGAYMYINHEDAKYFVFNGDIRFACAYRYLTFDIAAGLGAPLSDKYKGQDLVIAVEKLYWHAGTNLLLGNDFTQSLFIQAGLFNGSFTSLNSMTIGKNNLYLLVEPRFRLNVFKLHITAFNLPENTVNDLYLIDDPFGVNINLFTDSLKLGSKTFILGNHITATFINKNIFDISQLFEQTGSIGVNDINVNLALYASTDFLNGNLNFMLKIRFMDFVRGKGLNAIGVSLGFKTQL